MTKTQHLQKKVVQWSTSMLAAGALLLPALSAANIAANTPANTPVASSAIVSKTATSSPAPNDLRKFQKSLKQLNLNADQQQKVDQLLEQAKPQAAKLQKDMRENGQQLRDISYSTNYDAKEVTALANHQGELVSEMLILRAKLNVDIYKILTAEQQTQLRTLMEEKAAKKGGAKQP